MSRRRPPGSRSPVRPATRRAFLRALGAAGALPLIGTLPAVAQPPRPEDPPPAAPPPETEDTEDAADARSLGEIIQRRFGSRLSEPQVYAIRKDIEGGLAAGRSLRAVPLQNGDEPATLFRVLPLER